MQKLNLLGEQLFCPKALRHGACTCGVQSASSMQLETASFQAGKLAKDKNAEQMLLLSPALLRQSQPSLNAA